MGRVERNVFANLASAGWSAALGVLCLPLYIKLMGVEAFGLVGIFAMLRSVFVVLDLGIGATLCREIARLVAEGDNIREQRDLVFTLQFIYWLMALTIAATIFLLAPTVAHHWVRAETISTGTLTNSIRMMGIALALQFAFVFYQGGLIGLQRQVLLNGITVSQVTLRSLGALLALHLISPIPEVFFAGQIVAGAAGTGAVAVSLWRCLPASHGKRVRFRPEIIRRLWRFSAAFAANSVTNLGLLQGDKIILSRLLSLEMFGYYALAHGIASGLYAVIMAVVVAIFPQFSGLVARGDEAEISRAYHRGCQLMSVMMVPVAVTTVIFSREVLLLLTGDPVIVEKVYLILTLVAGGMLLHGLIQPLYYLQMAYDRWRPIARANLILLLCFIPLYLLMARRYGGTGAASVWVILNVCYLFILPFMYRPVMRGQQWRWLFKDVGLPVAGVLVIVGAAYWLLPAHSSRFELLAYLIATGLLGMIAAAALASRIRNPLVAQMRRLAAPFSA